MADDINVRIALTGEKNFTDAMKKIGAAVKESQSSLKLADTQLDKTGRSMEGLAKQSAALEKALKAQQDKVAVIGEEIARASEKYGSASSFVSKLRDEQNKANIEITNLTAALEENRQAIDEVGKSADHLREVQSQLDSGIEGYRDTLAGYNEQLAEAVEQYGENSAQADVMRESIARVSATISDMSGEAEENARALKQVEKAERDAAEEAQEAGPKIRSIRDAYSEAGEGALGFADVVKGTAIGSLIADGISVAIGALRDFAKEGAETARDYEVNQQKLVQVMGNTMRASQEQIDAVTQLIEQQEQLGVVSKNAQTAAAQEFATYTTKRQSIEKLIPVMNDMIAQQYGVNASSSEAISVATAVGKTLDGQVGSLSRWGYSFSDAQKRILEGNNELRKLDVIANVVSDSVGGMNKRLADTTEEGKLFKQSLELGDVQEKFGKNVDSIKNNMMMGLLPSITEVTTTINDFTERSGDSLANLGKIIGTVIEAVAGLLKVISALPPDLVMIIAIIASVIAIVLKAVESFSRISQGMEAAQKAMRGLNGSFDMTLIKIIAVVAAVSVLLYLILSLKEGTDKASRSMQQFGSSANNFANQNQQSAQGRSQSARSASTESIGGYASGTDYARRGLAWVGEEAPEILRKGNRLAWVGVNGPEILRFEGGEQVYNAAQSISIARQNAMQPNGNHTSRQYTDNSSLSIHTSDDEVMRQVRDWWANKRRRERGHGNGVQM